MKAKALFSVGLSYTGIDQWGEDARFAFPASETRAGVINSYRQFLREFPASSMADEALLALGACTGERTYLDELLRDYPHSDSVEKAKKLLQEMSSPYYRPPGGGQTPYTTLYNAATGAPPPDAGLADGTVLPPGVVDWVRANARRTFTGFMDSGQWRYLLVAAGERPTTGYGVQIMNVSDNGRGEFTVYYRLTKPKPGEMTGQLITWPYALVRIVRCDAAMQWDRQQ